MSPRAAKTPSASARAPKRPPRRGLWRAGVLVVVLGLAVFALVAWLQVTARPDGNPATVDVQIPRGATRAAIVRLLEGAHLTEHPTALGWVLKLSGAYEEVQAGVYTIRGDANALEIADALKERPKPATQLTLTLIPGETVWESADRIEALGVGPASDVTDLAADHAFVAGLGAPVGPPRAARTDGVAQTYLEGFLYPETYFLRPDATPRDAVTRAVAQFTTVWGRLKTRWRSDLLAVRARYGLSELDLVTMASLVEAEARDQGEAARIAGVFYNRLEKKMRLQTDPTLIYRPDRQGRAPTRSDRLDETNPYNTYATAGLPPGPICSPGERALVAALRPERHDLLYFVAMRDGTGRHAFARTLREHDANIARYLGGD